jgi:chitodextrinase
MRFGLATVFCLAGLVLAAPAWAAPTPGLVAAYGFDEGSGTTATDASGNGRTGSVTGATWATGRYGGALSFDGTNDYVGLPALGTFYNTAFTLEAWVQKATAKNDVGIVGTWAGNGPMLWIDHLATRYELTLGGSLSSYLDSGVNPLIGQWQHLAASFDGTTARYYINGVEVASRAVVGAVGTSNTWRIGAYGSVAGGFFDGIIDEIHVYDRALSAAEVQADMSTPLGITDPGAPTTPGNLAVTGNTATSISLGWTASTDDTGVAGYNVYADGAAAGTTSATSFTVTGLTCSTGHQFQVEAFDAGGNTSPRASVSGSTTSCGTSPGLVAAYGFNEGSGTAANDASGNGNNGTIDGASWVTGRNGGGLSFDGTNDQVSLGSLGTFYNSAFTLEAWVQKATAKKDVAVVGTWAGSGPMLWVDHLAGHHYATLGGTLSSYLDSGQTPVVGQWQHVAATFDGTTAHYYVDGALVASRAVSGSVGSSNTWRIGAYGASPGGFFDGVIDDVRVYNRALNAGEVQFDRDHGVAPPAPPSDSTPPSQPGTLTATGSLGQVALSWGAATDNVGVTKYNLHRSTTSGFTPATGNRIAQPTGLSYTDTGLAAGTYYYKVTAEDAAGNVGPASNQASALVTAADTTLPTVSITAPTAGTTVSGITAVNANASDNVGVAGVQFRVDGVNVGAEDLTAPYSLSWDTRAYVNGSHALSAVARDTSGNTRTSSSVSVTVSNTGASTDGLRVAYALNETSGTLATDSSGNNLTATTVGTTWTSGQFGGAASFDGVSDRVDVPALGTFYTSGFTYEAWVRKQTSKKDVAVLGSWNGNGPMIWVDHIAGHYYLTLGGSMSSYLDSGRTPTVGQWEHVAATYDGTVARFYIGGVEVASSTFTSGVGSSNNWRLGAYGGTPTGFFDGLIDNVRIYDRALSPAEIQTNMASAIQPESIPPIVTGKTPAAGANGVNAGTAPTATFNEPMKASTITSTTFQLKDASNAVVPATVSYNATTQKATLTPQSALAYGATYTATVKGGTGGVTDVAGNALAASVVWSFTTEASPPQLLVVTSTARPFGTYVGEILRNEGLNAFTTIDVSFLSPALLSGFDVVVLGEAPLSASQVTTLTGWVNGGGNLIAFRPDKQLAGLFGLTSASGNRSNAYLKVDATVPPGTGIVDSTMQYHGTADNYTLNGATAVAMLYSNSTTATTNPAVTLRSVGSSGGQAAAFTYDLARSVVYTRQGNPSWATTERDGVAGIRPDDMFYSTWLDTNKIAIPQADEQQRLLANLITSMDADKMPLPRFWYLPRGEKAVVVMSGDDHAPSQAPGGTASNFDRFKALSPAGCNVADWECVRSSSYIYPDNPLTNAQAAAYTADGFEVGLHPLVASCPTATMSAAQLSTYFDTQLGAFAAKYTSIPSPVSSRTHCVYWPDWSSNATVELAHGIRLDGNYYHFPGAWIGSKPGFMNGGGFPMRFAAVDGTPIDVYQQNTNVTDESGQDIPTTIAALLDNAVGPAGYYGAFGANMHTDNPAPDAGAEAIVAAAQARDVPVISYKQMLDWVDGRDDSTIRSLVWNAGTFNFTLTVGAGANGLQTLLPLQGPSGTLSAISLGGSPVTYTVQTIKGVQYAMFTAVNGTYQATYS